MLFRLTIATLALVISLASFAKEPNPSRAEIIETLDKYLSFCRARNGSEAAALIDPVTVEYYESVRDWVLYSNRSQVMKLPLYDRIQVMMLRGQFVASDIENLDGRRLFALTVDVGAVSGRPVEHESLGEMEWISENRARIKLEVAAPSDQSLWFEFFRSAERWHINIAHIRTIYEATKEVEIRSKERDEDEYLRSVVKYQFGDVDYEALWDPLKD